MRDELINYEVGMKSLWADRRVTFNAAAFYMKWKNLQVAGPGCYRRVRFYRQRRRG